MACKIKKTDYFKSEQNQCNKKNYMFEIYTFKPLLLKSYMCQWIVNCFLYSVKKIAFFVVNGCFSPVVRTSYNKTI